MENVDRETRFITAKLVIGGIGIVLTIFGYFLVDRDIEIRKNLANLATALNAISNKNGEISVRIEELGKRFDKIEEGQRTRGERISRLEALIERLRDSNNGH